MGRPRGWNSQQTGRLAMRSLGLPPAGRREHRVRSWEAIARGAASRDPAAEAGVSAAVGVRWFREGGGGAVGRPAPALRPPTSRSLSGKRSPSFQGPQHSEAPIVTRLAGEGKRGEPRSIEHASAVAAKVAGLVASIDTFGSRVGCLSRTRCVVLPKSGAPAVGVVCLELAPEHRLGLRSYL